MLIKNGHFTVPWQYSKCGRQLWLENNAVYFLRNKAYYLYFLKSKTDDKCAGTPVSSKHTSS